MTAGLFVGHHRGPDTVGVEVGACIVQQDLRIGFEQTRRKAFANQAALAIAPVGIEAIAHHALAVAKRIGDDGHQAGRHFGEVDVGIAYRRCNRLGDFTNIDDADRHGGVYRLNKFGDCRFPWVKS